MAGSSVVGPAWGSDPPQGALARALTPSPQRLSLLAALPSPGRDFQTSAKSGLEEPALGRNRLPGPAAHTNTD